MSVLDHVKRRKRVGVDVEPRGARDSMSWGMDGFVAEVNMVPDGSHLPSSRDLWEPRTRETTSLAARIPPGMRAVAVNFMEAPGPGGLIGPGDHVDVIATFSKDVMGKDQAVILLQDVLVLAVARTSATVQLSSSSHRPMALEQELATSGAGTAAAGSFPSVSTPKARTVTLAVTLESAQRLALAEGLGQLRYAIRGSGEEDSASARPVSLRQLLRRRRSPGGRDIDCLAPAELGVSNDEVAAPSEASVALDAPRMLAVITLDAANVRSEPCMSASCIDEAQRGAELEILEQSPDWLKVRLPDEREGWVASGWVMTVARQRGDEDVRT